MTALGLPNGHQPQQAPKGQHIAPSAGNVEMQVADVPIQTEEGVRIEKRIVFINDSVNGTTVYFYTVEQFEKILAAGAQLVQVAKSGLLIAPPGSFGQP